MNLAQTSALWWFQNGCVVKLIDDLSRLFSTFASLKEVLLIRVAFSLCCFSPLTHYFNTVYDNTHAFYLRYASFPPTKSVVMPLNATPTIPVLEWKLLLFCARYWNISKFGVRIWYVRTILQQVEQVYTTRNWMFWVNFYNTNKLPRNHHKCSLALQYNRKVCRSEEIVWTDLIDFRHC